MFKARTQLANENIQGNFKGENYETVKLACSFNHVLELMESFW